MLATTAYESPDASYTFSIQQSRQALESAGVATSYLLLSGNCHVDDARNVVAREFLASDCTDLVFLDADVSWEPAALVRLCRYDCDLVGGVYPFRREGSRGMPVRMIEGVTEPDESGLLEVEGLPAGFLRIRRVVIETLAKDAKKYRHPGHDTPVSILFERTYKDGARVGGDISFCFKWIAVGGKCHAAYEMVLGHTAKAVLRDSLGAALRRQADTTLAYVARQIRAGSEDLGLFTEAREYIHNGPWAATEDTLALAVLNARKAKGPILEAGSGLTTVLMAAAAPDQMVYCLEHDRLWALQTEIWARKAGVGNIGIVHCSLKDGWYDIQEDLPAYFALGLNDGPPRRLGSRVGFFDHGWATVCETVICDDADDPGYAAALRAWAAQHGRKIDFVGERAALIRQKERKAA